MNISVDDFDLRDPDSSLPMWLVYDGYLKVYEKRGPAINRFLSGRWYRQSDAKLFEWDPSAGVWHMRAHLNNDVHAAATCQHCTGSTVRSVPHRQLPENQGRFVFERRKRKYVDPLNLMYLCPDCQDQFS